MGNRWAPAIRESLRCGGPGRHRREPLMRGRGDPRNPRYGHPEGLFEYRRIGGDPRYGRPGEHCGPGLPAALPSLTAPLSARSTAERPEGARAPRSSQGQKDFLPDGSARQAEEQWRLLSEERPERP